jgi:hypothetical protein
MQMIEVDSSMLSAVGYDPATKTLRAVFNSGKTYNYFKVPQEVYDQLMDDDSKGGYMRSLIIDQYPYEEIKANKRGRR